MASDWPCGGCGTVEIRTVFWQALTPVHSGTGQTSASVIDLPIAREVATGYPVIPASSIKGVLRDGREGTDEYGYANKEVEWEGKKEKVSKAGDLTFTDARVLCLPVRSYKGTFAYLTCPLVLQRFVRDQRAFALQPLFASLPSVNDTDALVTGQTLVHQGKLILEDIDLSEQQSQEASVIAEAIAKAVFSCETEQKLFLERFAIVQDDVFAFFSETATEVAARVKLKDDSKTVQDGGLWYEEAIPAETLFSSFVLSSAGAFGELEKQQHLQIGGKASVGRGLLRLVVK